LQPAIIKALAALGLLLAGALATPAGVLYVDPNSANPTPPYATWATAATNIQDATAAAAAQDRILVADGICAAGSQGAFRVTLGKPIFLSSLNGPQSSVIDGGGALGCIHLAEGAGLSGFTLTNGTVGVSCQSTNALVTNCIIVGNFGGGGSGAQGGTLDHCLLSGNTGDTTAGAAYGALYNCTLSSNVCSASGAGAYACTLSNCTLLGNCSQPGAPGEISQGGGAYLSTLNNCTLIGNLADFAGGGAALCTLANCVLSGNITAGAGAGAGDCTLNNCTVTDNSAGQGGGGAYGCTVNNSIVYYNNPNDYDPGSTLNYCCTGLMPPGGGGNITNAPRFVDQAGGNLRLQSNSPCINAGNEALVTGTTDRDGRPRIVGGTADIGAYEFQPGVSGVFIGWLQSYGLPTDGSADFIDSDGNGMNNWQKWRCGLNPLDPNSVLRMLALAAGPTNVTVTWQSVAGISYLLERSATPGSANFIMLATNIPGQPGTTSFTDTNAAGAGRWFYRVGVGN
jgi:hypothetical protein